LLVVNEAWWAPVARLDVVAGWLQLLIDWDPKHMCVFEAPADDKGGLGYQGGLRKIIVLSLVVCHHHVGASYAIPPQLFCHMVTWPSHHLIQSICFIDIYASSLLLTSSSLNLFFLFLGGNDTLLNFLKGGKR
jgi:hypothetical protein